MAHKLLERKCDDWFTPDESVAKHWSAQRRIAELESTPTCAYLFIRIDGKNYHRNTDYFDRGGRCHDCMIVNKPGNIHHYGCDMERCPRCGNQLISCDCQKEGVAKKLDAVLPFLPVELD